MNSLQTQILSRGLRAIAFDPSAADSGRDAMWQLSRRCDLGIATPIAEPSPESWARIIEALNKHHPGWIDGNGSAVDKVVKFIEEAK